MPFYNPLDSAIRENPYPAYEALRRRAPVYWVDDPGWWAVSRYRDVRAVLEQPNVFSSSPMVGLDSNDPTTSLLASDPPIHARLRKVANRGFTRAGIGRLEARVRAIAGRLRQELPDTGTFDLIRAFASPFPVAVIADMLGIDPERRSDFQRWSDSLMVATTGRPEDAERREIEKDVEAFRAYMHEIAEARRRTPGDDLISGLIVAGGEEPSFVPEQVPGFATLLLLAGNETTRNLIGNAVLALLTERSALQDFVQDRSIAPSVVEEALRYDAPVQLVVRQATADVRLGGVRLRAGDRVAALLGSANRDEQLFDRPERFDVFRNSKDHLAFGLRTHFCLGSHLARLEARVALEVLLPLLRRSHLVPGSIRRLDSVLVRGATSLLLSLEPPGNRRPVAEEM